MAMQNPYARYKTEAILNASQEELTLMLFDGALKFCNQAIQAAEDNQGEKAYALVTRVQNIIEEFQITLDHAYPIAKDLDQIYDYLFKQLAVGGSKGDLTVLKEITAHLRTLRDTWKQAMVIAKRQR